MAAAGFRTRKVKLEQSIGDKLKRARIRHKISVAEVEEATKIRAKFILALESDSWDQIPSEVYGRGYLEAYAQFLKLPVEDLMKQYDRARAMYKRYDAAVMELAPVSRQSEPRFLLTPRFFFMFGAAAAIVAFSGLVVTQVMAFTKAPLIELTTPVEAKTIGTSQLEIDTTSFTVTGRTSQGAVVTVNGKPAQVLADDTFSLAVPVERGTVNPIVVDAVSASGTKTETTLSVTVK